MIKKDGTVDDNFGQELILDLYDCDPEIIASYDKIKEFVITLCDEVIHMKRFGEPQIPHFGHDNPITSGYSLTQLIETSLVSAHFSEFKKSVYLNIFSCAWFDAKETEDFCVKFFNAKSVKATLTARN